MKIKFVDLLKKLNILNASLSSSSCIFNLKKLIKINNKQINWYLILSPIEKKFDSI